MAGIKTRRLQQMSDALTCGAEEKGLGLARGNNVDGGARGVRVAAEVDKLAALPARVGRPHQRVVSGYVGWFIVKMKRNFKRKNKGKRRRRQSL